MSKISKALVAGHPLLVMPQLARLLGINHAHMLQQIHYWISDKRAQSREGKRWHYETYEDWQKQFEWLSVRTIKRIAQDLEDSGLVISKQFNKHTGNMVKWYTINYEKLDELVEADHSANLSLSKCQPDLTIVSTCADHYTETTAETSSETNNNNNTAPPEPLVDAVVDKLKKGLKEIGVIDKVRDEILKSYSPEKIESYLNYTNDPKTQIKSSKAGFFLEAIKNDWCIPIRVDKKKEALMERQLEEERKRLAAEELERNKILRDLEEKEKFKKNNPHLYNEDGSPKVDFVKDRDARLSVIKGAIGMARYGT